MGVSDASVFIHWRREKGGRGGGDVVGLGFAVGKGKGMRCWLMEGVCGGCVGVCGGRVRVRVEVMVKVMVGRIVDE